MGLVQAVRNVATLFMLLQIVIGLTITGLSVYFLIENNRSGVLGSYSTYTTWAPFALGLALTLAACLACGCRTERSGLSLYVFGFSSLVAGVLVCVAGVVQLQGMAYVDELSHTADWSALAAGPFSARHKLESYTLGLFADCCLKNTTEFSACVVGGAPVCFHNADYYLIGSTDDVVCGRVTVEPLKLCPVPSTPGDVFQFELNLYNYAHDKFYIAAMILTILGGLLSTTCFMACFAARENNSVDP
jgi:hypothetical protein